MIANFIMFAGFVGGWEIVLILTVVLILFGARRLPELGQGLREGFWEFRKATRDVCAELDDEAARAGKSFGGIYGKPAAEAIAHDNRVAEFYDVERPPHLLPVWLKRLIRWFRNIRKSWRR